MTPKKWSLVNCPPNAIEMMREWNALVDAYEAMRAAFAPVLDWYNGDGRFTDLAAMLAQAVADLQEDRAENLRNQADAAIGRALGVLMDNGEPSMRILLIRDPTYLGAAATWRDALLAAAKKVEEGT